MSIYPKNVIKFNQMETVIIIEKQVLLTIYPIRFNMELDKYLTVV